MAKSSRIAGVFPIGDSGEFAIAEWHPDPEIMEAEIIKMADDFDDWAIPMQAARETMIESTRLHFETESDPEGRKWVPLDPVYKSDKDAHGFPDQILVRNGDLEAAATSEHAWFVAQDAIWFNAGALPEYGPYHQAGTGIPGTTGFHRIMRSQSPEQIFALTEKNPRVGKMLAAFPGNEGSGKNLPQRAFIGADEDAIAELEAIFVAHLERTVEVPWKSIGGGGAFTSPVAGDIVQTQNGIFGTLTSIPTKTGGFMVRGEGGRFIGQFRH